MPDVRHGVTRDPRPAASATEAARAWIGGRRRRRDAIQLLCFPYAGGGSWIYQHWQDGLPDGIDVRPIELPGRGARRREPPFSDLGALVRALRTSVMAEVGKPYALFGHSLGARIAIELAAAIRSARADEPLHIFLSGINPPRAADDPLRPAPLPPARLLARLRWLGGTPPEALDDGELMASCLPVLNADFQLSDTPARPDLRAFDVPITVLMGDGDPTTSRALAEQWRTYSTGAFRIETIPGDHFFLHASRDRVIETVAAALAPLSTSAH
jgi:surfactin synthase thioesterase subunit